MTLVAGVGIFFLLPLFVASVTAGSVQNGLVQHLVEGLVRVGIFLGYLILIGRAPDIRRVFQYHGAEHMTIHALEAGDPLTVDAVRRYPTAHQRCGTEFLVIVILLSIIAFSLVGRQDPLIMVGSRILLIPVIASVGYEILRFGARHRANPILKVLLYPGSDRPDDHDQAAERRHDRGRDRLDGAGARGRRRAHPDRFGRLPPRADADRHPGHGRRRPARPAAGVVSSLDAKLAEVAHQYDDLQAELARPEVSSDPSELRRLGRELARLEPAVAAFRRLEATRTELAGAREVRGSSDADDELRQMAREEIDRLEADEARLLDELKVLLLPRDPNDDRDVILEIRAGAGGEEAALFAAELYRMYWRYAERHRFTPELLSLHETGIGGIKEAIIQVHGDGAYSRLKFEGGVHRVQRIPATESSGRIHTSTVTVVVLPGGRRGRDRDRRGTRPADRRQAFVGSGRPVGQHHGLCGPDHPPADRPGGRDPGREEPAQEQGQGPVRAAVAAVRPPAAEAARGRFGGATVDGRLRAIAPTRSGPTTSRRIASPITGSGRPSTTCRASLTAISTT